MSGKPERQPAKQDSKDSGDMPQTLAERIIRLAIKFVPQVKYALAVAALIAAVAIVKALGISVQLGLFGAMGMLILMILFLGFVHIEKKKNKLMEGPAVIMTWFSVVIFVLLPTLLFTSVFFQWPVDLKKWIDPSPSTTTAPAVGSISSAQASAGGPRAVMAWFSVVMVVVLSGLIVSSVFFQWPIDLRRWVDPTATTTASLRSASDAHGDVADQRLIKAAELKAAKGDFTGAWELYEEGLARGQQSAAVLQERAKLAMVWLRSIEMVSPDDGESFTMYADKLLPVLEGALASGGDTDEADLRAHFGWAKYLRSLEQRATLEGAESFDEAMAIDPQNVYANTFAACLLLRGGGPNALKQAKVHFDMALRAGKERDFVRRYQLRFSRGSSAQSRIGLLKLADEMRKAGEQLPPGHVTKGDLTGAIYPWPDPPDEDLLTALPPADHLQTFCWLTAGDSDSDDGTIAYWQGRLLEFNGDNNAALKVYLSLAPRLGAESVARCGKNGAASAALAAALEDRDPKTRARAADYIPIIHKPPELALPMLTRLLHDDDSAVREAARGQIITSFDATASIPAMLGLLKSNVARDRVQAVTVLERMGATAELLPTLIECLDDADATVRETAARTIARIDPPPPQAVAALIETLKDPSAEVRSQAAQTLGGIGTAAHAAVPALIDRIQLNDTRYYGIEALGKIGPAARDAVPVLTRVLEEGDPDWQQQRVISEEIAKALVGIGADAKAALPALGQSLQNQHYLPGREIHAKAIAAIAKELRVRKDTTAAPLLQAALIVLRDDAAKYEDEPALAAAKTEVSAVVDFLEAIA